MAGQAITEAMPEALHVTNGDSAAGTLLETPLVERVLSWRDVLHEGPVPAAPDDELRRVRAAVLAADTPHEAEQVRLWLEDRDKILADNADGLYVLWFEADLYDQLQLIQVLEQLAAIGVPADRVTLICVGEFPGIAHFGGLGELDATQLEEVARFAAAPLTRSALDVAHNAWTAFRADTPSGHSSVARTHHRELRFVAEAFDRLGREYPSTRDGLALTERRILAALRDGATSAEDVFHRLAAREARPFLGDTSFLRILADLATVAHPLVAAADVPVRMSTELRLTTVGDRLLAGTDDHVRLNGVDRWIGGVHLVGRAVAWRWHEGMESVVPVAEDGRLAP